MSKESVELAVRLRFLATNLNRVKLSEVVQGLQDAAQCIVEQNKKIIDLEDKLKPKS